MAQKEQTKKPAIPQSGRIKYALDDVEDNFQNLKKYFGQSPSPEAEIAYEEFEKALIKLVHLDNTQLYHPYVQYYLLSWPNNKDFLRKLHRGLETGVRRQITWQKLWILVALDEGEEKGQSLHQIQSTLEKRGNIMPMSPQNFYKLVNKLRSDDGTGNFPLALPPKPKDLPPNVNDAWDKARKNLHALRTSPEAKKRFDDYIQERGLSKVPGTPILKPKLKKLKA